MQFAYILSSYNISNDIVMSGILPKGLVYEIYIICVHLESQNISLIIGYFLIITVQILRSAAFSY